METRANYITVGIFVLGLMISALVFVLWMSRIDFGTGARLYDIYFRGSVSGLRLNEDVRYHGIPIGKVKEITIDSQNPDHVRVRVAIKEHDLMRKDVISSIEIQGLTGYTYVQIQGGSASSPLLKAENGQPYPVIPSQPSRIDLLFSNIPHILSSIYELSEQLNDLFDEENREEIRYFIRNISKISGQLAEGKNSLVTLIGKTENTLGKIDSLVPSMRTSLDSLSRAAEGVQSIIRENKDRTAESLEQLPKTLRQVRIAADQPQKLINEFENNPFGSFSKAEEQGYRAP